MKISENIASLASRDANSALSWAVDTCFNDGNTLLMPKGTKPWLRRSGTACSEAYVCSSLPLRAREIEICCACVGHAAWLDLHEYLMEMVCFQLLLVENVWVWTVIRRRRRYTHTNATTMPASFFFFECHRIQIHTHAHGAINQHRFARRWWFFDSFLFQFHFHFNFFILLVAGSDAVSDSVFNPSKF